MMCAECGAKRSKQKTNKKQKTKNPSGLKSLLPQCFNLFKIKHIFCKTPHKTGSSPPFLPKEPSLQREGSFFLPPPSLCREGRKGGALRREEEGSSFTSLQKNNSRFLTKSIILPILHSWMPLTI